MHAVERKNDLRAHFVPAERGKEGGREARYKYFRGSRERIDPSIGSKMTRESDASLLMRRPFPVVANYYPHYRYIVGDGETMFTSRGAQIDNRAGALSP